MESERKEEINYNKKRSNESAIDSEIENVNADWHVYESLSAEKDMPNILLLNIDLQGLITRPLK